MSYFDKNKHVSDDFLTPKPEFLPILTTNEYSSNHHLPWIHITKSELCYLCCYIVFTQQEVNVISSPTMMHVSYDVCGVWYAKLKRSLHKLNIDCHIYGNPNVGSKFFKTTFCFRDIL